MIDHRFSGKPNLQILHLRDNDMTESYSDVKASYLIGLFGPWSPMLLHDVLWRHRVDKVYLIELEPWKCTYGEMLADSLFTSQGTRKETNRGKKTPYKERGCDIKVQCSCIIIWQPAIGPGVLLTGPLMPLQPYKFFGPFPPNTKNGICSQLLPEDQYTWEIPAAIKSFQLSSQDSFTVRLFEKNKFKITSSKIKTVKLVCLLKKSLWSNRYGTYHVQEIVVQIHMEKQNGDFFQLDFFIIFALSRLL